MSEIKNNVTRQGIYLGKTTTGSLECLPPGNVLIVGQTGHGFETLMNSILCNHMYMGNPKEEKILLYYDKMSVSPEWEKGWEGCPIIGGVYGEKEDSRDVLSDFASGIGMLVADRVGFLGRDGVLPEDNNCHYTVFAVFNKNVRSLDDNPDFCKLMMCAHSCRENKNINIDFVIALEHHVPDINHVFNWVCCTPLGDDEFANVVMGSNYPARSPWSYGVVFYRQNHAGYPISKLNVIYRPDTYIQKLLKSFKVKKSKSESADMHDVSTSNETSILRFCPKNKDAEFGYYNIPLTNVAIAGVWKSGKTTILYRMIYDLMTQFSPGYVDFKIIDSENTISDVFSDRCYRYESAEQAIVDIEKWRKKNRGSNIKTVVFIEQIDHLLRKTNSTEFCALKFNKIFRESARDGLYFVVTATNVLGYLRQAILPSIFGIKILAECADDTWPEVSEVCLRSSGIKTVSLSRYGVYVDATYSRQNDGSAPVGVTGVEIRPVNSEDLAVQYKDWSLKVSDIRKE